MIAGSQVKDIVETHVEAAVLNVVMFGTWIASVFQGPVKEILRVKDPASSKLRGLLEVTCCRLNPNPPSHLWRPNYLQWTSRHYGSQVNGSAGGILGFVYNYSLFLCSGYLCPPERTRV